MANHPRTGIGYDVHPLTEGRPLILGGVRVEHSLGLAGHSDADVLTHAIIDGLLGAAGLNDIGTHFPDTEARWKDANSLELLVAAVELVGNAGYVAWNVDATVVIEQPKLAEHRAEMRANLATALSVPTDRVNVKATRGEKLGFVGRSEGAAAMAVVTVIEKG